MEKTDDFLYGTRAVIEAINAGKTINKILIKNQLNNTLIRELKGLASESEITIQFVPEQKLNRLGSKNHQGVVALTSPVAYHNIETILPAIFESGNNPSLLILDGITDSRNFGAIARTAECMGVDAIIIPTTGSAQITSDAIKTSAGALHHIPVCKVKKLKETVQYLQSSGVSIVCCTEKGTEPVEKIDFTRPTAVVMGSEESGISDAVLRIADDYTKVDMVGKIASLNVGIACGMILYEMSKQRN